MAAAAHYGDIGMELPSGFDTDRMLMPTRSPVDAVPPRSSGSSRPDGAQDPMEDETMEYAHRVLIHERRQNIVHFPDHGDIIQWAITRGNLGRAGGDVHSRRQAGRGPVPWVEPALTGITASSTGIPGVPTQGGDSNDSAWPWSTTAHRL
eukprot:6680017-Pyramimonas_sp.AAC.1